MANNTDFLDFAHDLADMAREVTLHYFRHPLDVTQKSDDSPVTLADQSTEQRLRDKITARFPDHGIIGEEQSAKTANSDYEWIIDPIDGTKNFICGYPLFGTLIALLKNGQPIVSVIDAPAQDERFFATIDMKTRYRKGQDECTIHSNQHSVLSTAKLFSTDYTMFSDDEHHAVQALRQAVSMVRYNGDCYLYAMLAAGWIDIVLEADLKVYDFLPLLLIVEQAGGVISDWQGKPLNKHSCGQVIACANQTMHRVALSHINTTHRQ